MVNARELTRQEFRFAQLVAKGWPLSRCYLEATGAKVAKKNHAEVQAWRWRLRPAVESEIIRQRAALTEATAMTRAEKRNVLGEIARRETTPESVRVSAIAVDNRMTGDDEPFRKAAGDDLRVQFFVLRIGEADTRGEPVNVTPAPSAPSLPP